MAEQDTLALPPPETGAKKGRGGKWILTLLILTAISVATGGGFGLLVASSVERTVEARVKAEAQKEVPATPYSGDIVLKALDPVVTNLASSDDAWVRIESALVMASADGANDVLVIQALIVQ
jgi:flagellar protein FliL